MRHAFLFFLIIVRRSLLRTPLLQIVASPFDHVYFFVGPTQIQLMGGVEFPVRFLCLFSATGEPLIDSDLIHWHRSHITAGSLTVDL